MASFGGMVFLVCGRVRGGGRRGWNDRSFYSAVIAWSMDDPALGCGSEVVFDDGGCVGATGDRPDVGRKGDTSVVEDFTLLALPIWWPIVLGQRIAVRWKLAVVALVGLDGGDHRDERLSKPDIISRGWAKGTFEQKEVGAESADDCKKKCDVCEIVEKPATKPGPVLGSTLV